MSYQCTSGQFGSPSSLMVNPLTPPPHPYDTSSTTPSTHELWGHGYHQGYSESPEQPRLTTSYGAMGSDGSRSSFLFNFPSLPPQPYDPFEWLGTLPYPYLTPSTPDSQSLPPTTPPALSLSQQFHVATPIYEPTPLSTVYEQQKHPTSTLPFTEPTNDGDIYAAGSTIKYTDDNLKYIAEVCLSGLGLAAELSDWPHPSRPARCTTTSELEAAYATYDPSLPPQEEEPNLPPSWREFVDIQHQIFDSEPKMAEFDSSPSRDLARHPKTTYPTITIIDSTTHGRELSAPARQNARLDRRPHPYPHPIPLPPINTPSDQRDRPPRNTKKNQDKQARFRPDKGEAKTTNKVGFEEEEQANRYLSSGQCPSERDTDCRTQNIVRSVGVTTRKEKPAVATERGKRGPNKSSRAGELTFHLNQRPSTRKPRKGSKRTIEQPTTAPSSNQTIEEAARVESQASTSRRFYSHTRDTFAIQLISPEGPKGWKPVAVLPLDAHRFAPNSDV